MLVSIYCITYNHERFIAQAIESFLMQQTNFDFEIVIGEDCSTDNTASIVKEYAQKYPNIIKARCNEVNIGMHANSLKTLQECSGVYIAKCDGDDYWTDPCKLQKQVNFLEENLDFSICFHPPKIWNENEQRFYDYEYVNSIPPVTDIYCLASGNYVPTQTVMYRKNDTAIKELALINTPMTDYTFCMLQAKYGKIQKLPDSMSVYRIHEGGYYQRKINYDNMVRSMNMLKSMFPYFEDGVVTILKKQYFRIADQVLENFLTTNNYLQVKEIIRDLYNIDPNMTIETVSTKISTFKQELESLKKSKFFILYKIIVRPIKYLQKTLQKN